MKGDVTAAALAVVGPACYQTLEHWLLLATAKAVSATLESGHISVQIAFVKVGCVTPPNKSPIGLLMVEPVER